jgi:tetratricopeptide (TPR) repeat protein
VTVWSGRVRRQALSTVLRLGVATLAAPTPVVAQPAVDHPVDRFPDALDQYRRIELLVPGGFGAACERAGQALICRLSGMPESFIKVLRALRGGAIEKVDIRGRRKDAFEVHLALRRADLDFRSTILAAPSRWVLEVGLPLTMSDPVEDEVPFRPYPLAVPAFEPVLPKSPVEVPKGRGAAVTAVAGCVADQKKGQHRAALASCAEAERVAGEEASLAALAAMARAESAAELALAGRAPDLTTVTEALSRAEAVAPTPEAKARFVILQARSYEPMGFPARGELHLENRLATYKGTPAEPWLLAGQLAGEFEAGNAAQADAIVKKLQGMAGDNPNVGGAVLLAAGQAYERRDWVKALELFDNALRRWPAQVESSPEALFLYAEACAYFGRNDDARRLYDKYLERFPRKKPHHIVRVRLADLSAATDGLAARARLTDLALAIPEAEGQHLAALHAIRMTADAKERRRTLRQVERAGPTDFVRAELLAELARTALANGRVRESFEHLREIWRRYPNDALLTRAPKLPDRVLYLLMHNYVALDRPLAAISTYYAERRRFEAHGHREQMHLLAGRAFNRLGMSEEAFTVFQRGLRQAGTLEPEIEARIYLEMADALHALGDRFRLREILRYLDKKYPGRFDEFAYWRARAADARWSGQLPEARDIYVYALNGPVTDEQRAVLAGDVAELYVEMGNVTKAVAALEVLIALHDRAGKPKDSPVRRAAAWRVAEVAYDGRNWPAALDGLGRFLSDYPTDPNRLEAIFLKARALRGIGDVYSAVKLYDQLVSDPKGGRYGALAGLELDLLKWERREAPGVLREAGFPAVPTR